MSDKVTVYEATTGKIRRVLMLPLVGLLNEAGDVIGHTINPIDLANNLAGDERCVPGEFASDRFYWDGRAMVALPDPPSEWAEFDFETRQWVDLYDPVLALEAARASANMTRSDFLLAAISAGIILPSDAGPAARGEIPPSLVPVFDGLPPEVRIEAVVRWGAATVIERTNPVLAALAEAMAITDAELDALFGINLTTEWTHGLPYLSPWHRRSPRHRPGTDRWHQTRHDGHAHGAAHSGRSAMPGRSRRGRPRRL